MKRAQKRRAPLGWALAALLTVVVLPLAGAAGKAAAAGPPAAPVLETAQATPGETPGETKVSGRSEGEAGEKLEAARRLLGQKQWRSAIEAFKEADRLMGGCAECQVGIATALNEVSSYGEAAASARRAIAATKDRMLLARAHQELGIALCFPAKAGRGALEEAAQSFRTALELSGGAIQAARYYLGATLIRLGKAEEGAAELRGYRGGEPGEPTAADAREMIAEAQRPAGSEGSGASAAPDLVLESLDGQQVQLSSLRGKVVLLDFWATWCQPCRASLPSLKNLARKLAGEPFALVSISTDANGVKLREFLSQHGPEWMQFWDGNGVVAQQFGVKVLPTFVLLGSDGKPLYAARGWNLWNENRLSSHISKALKKLKSPT